MKKLALTFAAALMIISFSACSFLFSQPQPPSESVPPEQSSTPSASPSTSPDSTPSPTAPTVPGIDEPDPTVSPEASANPEETRELNVYTSSGTVTVTARAYSAPLSSDDISFRLFYDDEVCQVKFENNAYHFTPTGSHSDPLDYMEISFINGATAETLLPSLADSYIDFTDIEFSSYAHIGETGRSAESIVAYNGEQYFSAYLIELSDGVVTIALSSTSQHSDSFAWFSAMLATLSIE